LPNDLALGQPPVEQSLSSLIRFFPLEPLQAPISSDSGSGSGSGSGSESSSAIVRQGDVTLAKSIRAKPIRTARPELVQTFSINSSLSKQTDEGEIIEGQIQSSVGSGSGQVSLERSSGSLRRGLLPVLGAVGAAAIAVLGYSAFHSLSFNPVPPSETPSNTGTESAGSKSLRQKLDSSSTDQVKTIALNSLAKQQLAQGQQAIEVLLNRNALAEAIAALAAVPQEHQSDSDIQFLQGRLAWQAVKQGNPKYKLADARIAWENAAQDQPNSAQYQQALGFAYYAEGDPLKAKQAWEQAIALMQSPRSSTPGSAQSEADAQMQTAYAGVALAMRQISAQESSDRQMRISAKAVKVYRSVLASDPAHFTVPALRQNWLWNNAAIQDWEKLSQIES